jgi:cytochrome oxidase assembly protein ShyY1
LSRATEKREILDQVDQRRSESPLGLEQLLQREHPAYSQVILTGEYLGDRVILLDNRMARGQFGYEVVMPFRAVSGETLLVSRGWVQGSLRREELPELSAVVGPVKLRGEVYVPLGEAFTLGSTALPEGWPKRVPVLDVAALADALEMPLYPYVVRLRAGSETAFESYWEDVNILPAKHTAYAVQWFTMALALVVLYFAAAFGWLRSKRIAAD